MSSWLSPQNVKVPETESVNPESQCAPNAVASQAPSPSVLREAGVLETMNPRVQVGGDPECLNVCRGDSIVEVGLPGKVETMRQFLDSGEKVNFAKLEGYAEFVDIPLFCSRVAYFSTETSAPLTRCEFPQWDPLYRA